MITKNTCLDRRQLSETAGVMVQVLLNSFKDLRHATLRLERNAYTQTHCKQAKLIMRSCFTLEVEVLTKVLFAEMKQLTNTKNVNHV